MEKVNKNSNIPLHIQLSTIIRKMVESGELREGDSIISERELCIQQDVSRMTVNKAIMCLVSEGILYRVQGKGTFVAKSKQRHQFYSVQGFTDMMSAKGFDVKTHILSFEMEIPSEFIRRKLDITSNDTNVYKITRIRYINGEAFSIETVYISEDICNGFTKKMLDNKSLYTILAENYSYIIDKAEQSFEPIVLSENECKLLDVHEGTLGLRFQIKSYDIEDRVIEFTISILRCDKYQYELTLKR